LILPRDVSGEEGYPACCFDYPRIVKSASKRDQVTNRYGPKSV
jgi:hypothetical protein